MNSHSVEFSIAGCVEEIVGGPNPMPFLLVFIYIICFVLIDYWEQRVGAALAMVKKKLHPLCVYPPRHQGKNHQPKSLWSETNRTPAMQNKKSNSD